MVSTQAKRKKTAEMPDSPPKRVTRARATKEIDDAPVKPKTTRITTASTKAASEKKKAAVTPKAPASAPAKTTKRKTRADDKSAEAAGEPKEIGAYEEPVVNENVPTEPIQSKPGKTNGRTKKTTVTNEEERHIEVPRTRGRQPKATAVKDSAEPEVPKTRGRPRKTPEPTTTETQTKEPKEQMAPEPVKKVTRGRSAAVSNAKPVTAKPSTLSKSTTVPSKKRVKFEEGPDKENLPIQKDVPMKSAMKPTGLNAKPIRKPVAVRPTTRGRKATNTPATSSGETEKIQSMPLSPKKINQVAKSDPISEDELAGEKTPIRALSQSPSKRPMSSKIDLGSVSKLNFDQHTAPSSPAKPTTSSVLESPARRPPLSPFKDALKTSPRKLDFGDSIAKPALQSSRSPIKASLLQESPKRGVFADISVRPILLPSKSPFKVSLLQSPARRPNLSPVKASAGGSPEKPKSGLATKAPSSPSRTSSTDATKTSSETVLSSPFKAARPLEQRAKVHIITDEERSVITEKVFHPLSEVSSPEKQEIAVDLTLHPQDLDGVNSDSTVPESSILTKSPVTAPIKDGAFDDTDVDIQEAPPAFPGPAFAIGSSSLRRTSMESESSEDELASPKKIYEMTPLRRREDPAHEYDTPAVIGAQDEARSSAAPLSFTPLADQLNSWNTKSPERRTRPGQARGMFSIGGAAADLAIDQPTPVIAKTSPAKSSFFDDEMAIRDEHDDAYHTEIGEDNETNLAILKTSQDSLASEEYGDENAEPVDLQVFAAESDADATVTCLPAKVFTPARIIERPTEMYTVSKVPLRPSADESPLIVPRQRSRSFGGPLATVNQPHLMQAKEPIERPNTPVLRPTLTPQTPSSGMRLDAETPGRTVRKGIVPDILKGAVVHVDVHTTEGADASGIFVDLLTQMGARCVKQWHWNPRAGFGSSLDHSASPQELSPDAATSKIGITHVVYKDGGKRTLEKVRSSNGAVHCVGVGWVLE